MTARSITGSLAAVAFAVAVPCTFGQDVKGRPAQKPVKADMEVPKPAPEMSQLRFFDGSWTCAGTMSPSPFGPGGKMTSTVRSQTDLGGFWQSGTVKGTSPGMPPFEGRFNMTYDPTAKRHVMLWVDNMGGWAHSSASGWDGDKIVFAGDSFMAGKKFSTRDTFTKATGGTMRHSWEVQTDGKWAPVGDETCKKGAK
jgi:uncharacterized protein DUF1579